MPYHYTDQTRTNDPHALPDVEVFECICPLRWGGHGEPGLDYQHLRADCPVGGNDTHRGTGFYFAHGIPGCLWDSDPVGPFDTEAEALAEARSAAGE